MELSHSARDNQVQTEQPNCYSGPRRFYEPHGSETRDLETMFAKWNNSDTILKVENQEFRVHRLLLSARSPVFYAMFYHDTKENRSGIVEISDLSDTAVANMLHYMYFDEVSCNNIVDLCELHDASDKYDMIGLRSLVTSLIIKGLNLDNAAYVGLWSNAYNYSEILEAVKKFAFDNLILFKTEGWKELVTKDRALASTIILSVSSELVFRYALRNVEQPQNQEPIVIDD